MNFFKTRENTIIFIISVVLAALIVALAITLPLVLCKSDTEWLDKLTPEGTETIDVTSPAVKLPAKPDAAPTTDKDKPTAFGTAIASDECYTLQGSLDGAGLTVSYNSEDPLPAYAYVYIPVENYDGNAFLKIKADCNSVERLAVLAVYYEQFADSRPAVVVFNNAAMDGANTFICKLGESALLDRHYDVATGEKLTQKSICGFMLMIDSNPKQVIDEYSGTFTVTSISTVDENDPDLNKLYAAPYISMWKQAEGFSSCNITTSRSSSGDGMDAEIAYSVSGMFPRVEAAITNYKSDYTTVKMDVKGQNVKSLTIAIKYSLRSSADNIDYNYLSSFNMSVGSDWETLEYDFSTLEELKDWDGNTAAGSFVKNLNPTAIYFFVDGGQTNSGTLSVRNVTFEKAQEGAAPKVSSTWSMGAAGISKSGVAEGGIGTLTYDKRQGWNPVTIGVSSYNPEYTILVVRVKFYSGDASNLGIALGYGSTNTVVLQSKGMNPPAGFGIKLVDHAQEQGEDDNGEYTFHTFVIDFSNATTVSGGSDKLSEQSITKLLLYIDAAKQNSSGEWIDVNAGGSIAERKMQFVGIEFQKPQEQEQQ